jgi:Na+/H+-dicarboxylate symporter
MLKAVTSLKLWQQVVIGLVLGVLAGIVMKEDAASFKVLGTVFFNLIKMVMVPLIIFAILSGITSMDDPKNFSRVGIKGVAAYLSTAMFAVVIGLVAGNLFQPGVGLNISPEQLSASPPPDTAKQAPGVGEFLLNLIPTNALRAMTEDHFLQVIVFTMFFGIMVNLAGEKSQTIKTLIRETAGVLFRMIEAIVKLAPLAVFGFMAWVVGSMGVEILLTLIKLVACVVAACIFQYMLFGVMLAVFGKLSPMPFYRKMLTTQLMAFSTSSSKATLTTAMRELQQKVGASERNTHFLLPLGACINMDGTAIYLGICAVFFAQMFGIHLGFHEYLVLILTSTLGSIGAAGIPSGSIIFMGMVLGSVGIPIEGIGLILGVDRILDMVRTTVNITGDCAITLMIDRTEGATDEKLYYS